MYSYKFIPLAKEDITNAFNWYEEKSPGLGSKFLSALSVELNKINTVLVEEKKVYKDFQKHSFKEFPYYIYYKKDENKQLIIIFAVLHKKQDSATFYKRT